MSKCYRIREFAELAGVTVKALHHYDRIGLLKPRKRTQAGYRLYSESDLERLEQIVALKFLGLPLDQIRTVLDLAPLDLSQALRAQRAVLERRQQGFARALVAIEEAERALEQGKPADPSILKRLIQVINMQNDVDFMKQYFSDAAWPKARPRYEHGPSQEWKDLYREAAAALGEDPAGPVAQALAQRWMELTARSSGNDPEVQTGGLKAWIDRENWPSSIRQRLEEYNLEAIAGFIGRAMAAHRQYYYANDVWAKLESRTPEERLRAAVEWRALIAEANALIEEDPSSVGVQALAVRWLELAGDAERTAGSAAAWADRQRWPEWMKEQSTVLNLEKIGGLMGRAIACRRAS